MMESSSGNAEHRPLHDIPLLPVTPSDTPYGTPDLPYSSEITPPNNNDYPVPGEQLEQSSQTPQTLGRLAKLRERTLGFLGVRETRTPHELASQQPASEQEPIDTETMDTLQMELSSIPPHIQAVIKRGVQKVVDYAATTYGEFLPAATKDTVPHIADRTIVMSPDDFNAFFGVWDGSDEDPGEETGGVYFSESGIIAIKDSTDAYKNVEPSEINRITQQFINEGKLPPSTPLPAVGQAHPVVKNAIASAVCDETIAHEPYHALQDSTVPTHFLETGAHHYQTITGKALGMGNVDTTYKEACTAFYTDLLNKYGGDVHKLFFGSLNNDARRDQILAEFTSEKIKTLFPSD